MRKEYPDDDPWDITDPAKYTRRDRVEILVLAALFSWIVFGITVYAFIVL